MQVTLEQLLNCATSAASRAYSPYSQFPVGAAILSESGEIVTGVNVENRSYGLTICAERSAVCAAVSRGVTRFTAVAVSCPGADYPVSPCGACRQVLSEFCAPQTPVIFQGGKGEPVRTTMGQLFPYDSLHELAK
jgi:cytidine deaminase